MTEVRNPVEIVEALDAEALAACRELFAEYQREIGVSLCFQGFDRELATLPADYARPRGRLWLARSAAGNAGCVAIRALDADAAEMKRLYVRPEYRGTGLGRRLARLAVDTARDLGYRTIKLDTLRTMTSAQRLYGSLGFADAPRYNDNPLADVRFLALELSRSPVSP